MQKMVRNSAIVGISVLSTVLSGLLIKKKTKKLMKAKKCPEKPKKNWKKAIVWSAFYGMINGVFKLFLKEGQRKFSHRK